MGISARIRHLYPRDWAAISDRVRRKAGWRCQACGVREGAVGGRDRHGAWCPAEPLPGQPGRFPEPGTRGWCSGTTGRLHLRLVRIRIACCHLNHDPADCRPGNLRALCQRCHALHDGPHHAAVARQTRDAVRGQLALDLGG